jgi:hypothetical protein
MDFANFANYAKRFDVEFRLDRTRAPTSTECVRDIRKIRNIRRARGREAYGPGFCELREFCEQDPEMDHGVVDTSGKVVSGDLMHDIDRRIGFGTFCENCPQ